MALKDWMQPMWDKIRARNPFGQDDMSANMANGGHCGYKPNTAKHRPLREQTQSIPTSDPQMMDSMETCVNWAPLQQEQTTGFGGFANVPPQATGYQQTGYQQTGFQQQTGYQQPMGGWQPQGGMDAGMGNPFAAPQQSMGNTVPFPTMQQTQYQNPQNAAPVDNISYMPGNFVGEDGKAYSHCERIAVVNNVSMCYRVVEFMRNGESVIVSTEQIADEDENQRCLDLLYGAAFAMNYSFTKVSGKSIYLVSPATVLVIPFLSIRQMSDQDMNTRWPDPERDMNRRPMRDEGRYAGFNQGYGQQFNQSYNQGFNQGYRPQESYGFQRQGYAQQNDYTAYGYNAVGYGR